MISVISITHPKRWPDVNANRPQQPHRAFCHAVNKLSIFRIYCVKRAIERQRSLQSGSEYRHAINQLHPTQKHLAGIHARPTHTPGVWHSLPFDFPRTRHLGVRHEPCPCQRLHPNRSTNQIAERRCLAKKWHSVCPRLQGA